MATWTFHRESGEGSVTSANDEGGSPYRASSSPPAYRGTSLIRNTPLLGP